MKELNKLSNQPFDQFADKKPSTYNPDTYTSTLDFKKVTEQQKVVAEQVEKELKQKSREKPETETDEQTEEGVSACVGHRDGREEWDQIKKREEE